MKKILILLAIVVSISACAVYTPLGDFYTPSVLYRGSYDYYDGLGYGYYGGYYRGYHGGNHGWGNHGRGYYGEGDWR
jgi:hypothetical protein